MRAAPQAPRNRKPPAGLAPRAGSDGLAATRAGLPAVMDRDRVPQPVVVSEVAGGQLASTKP